MKKNDIRFVKQITKNGMTYKWFIKYKGVNNAADFINYENGRSVCKPYPVERLPKHIQQFIKENEAAAELFNLAEYENGDQFATYLYKAR